MTYEQLHAELCHWLDQQPITSENIGMVRHRCFLPFSTHWNAVVREETAARENKPQALPSDPETNPMGAIR